MQRYDFFLYFNVFIFLLLFFFERACLRGGARREWFDGFLFGLFLLFCLVYSYCIV